MKALKRFLRLSDRSFAIIVGLIVFLIVLRLILPVAVKYGINWALKNKVPGYYGYIVDFDLVLLRGKYRIEGLHLEKTGAPPSTPPLLKVNSIEVGLSWAGVFQGRLLSTIRIGGANIYLLDSKDAEKDQLGTTAETSDWRDLYWTLIPFEVSELRIDDSEIHFANIDVGLKTQFFLSDIHLLVRNIQNLSKDQARLPTPVFLRASLQGKAPVRVEGRTNFLRSPPEIDLDLELKGFELQEVNPLLLSYVPVSFKSGTVDLFAEAATRERRVVGYAKPFVEKVRVMGNREEFMSFGHLGVEFLTAIANLIFRDDEKTIATKVEFTGSFDDPQIRTGKAIWGALEHAYAGKEIEKKLDESISQKSLQSE